MTYEDWLNRRFRHFLFSSLCSLCLGGFSFCLRSSPPRRHGEHTEARRLQAVDGTIRGASNPLEGGANSQEVTFFTKELCGKYLTSMQRCVNRFPKPLDWALSSYKCPLAVFGEDFVGGLIV